ncbi:hypothetical protein [Amycolatopsis benzoatilytica]|uniref:hypothetical protein n=1 Tax=Amycolatopsis benzoatilytica TaxID=346045 RepID=UPI0003A2EE47|nr:hypothetical protein [Amycolatopsis benzoatilytica]
MRELGDDQSQAPGADSLRADPLDTPSPAAIATGPTGEDGSEPPETPGRGERVDRGGGTVADAIRSAMARRS